MKLTLAIVADDLTGALDTSAAFVSAGLKVAVAMTPDAAERALAAEPQVLAVNTASRAIAADAATARVRQVAGHLMARSPRIVMKKIDSRLKGNIAAECAALAIACGRQRLVVAPAVPDQGRSTRGGAVVGRGVGAPLPIMSRLADTGMPVEVCDAEDDADLDAIVAGGHWEDAVAVGARGLGLAFVRHLGGHRQASGSAFPTDSSIFYAFGSRDPITDGQVARLASDNPATEVIDAPGGRFDLAPSCTLPLVIRCTGDLDADPNIVATRFAAGVAAAVERLRPSTLVMGGGDTALAILGALGADVLFPQGEAAPGLPWFTITTRLGWDVRCVVKSGGFGTVAVLSEFLKPQISERAELR